MRASGLIVLVEGESDALAIRALCDLRGLDPELDDVDIIPMGGITNIGHHVQLRDDPSVTVIGLCDEAETHWVERAFGTLDGFHVCRADLEEELIRAIGADGMIEFIESEGELDKLHLMQQQPHQRGRPIDAQLHRFIGTKSGRKHRYGRGLVLSLGDKAPPPPLSDLVDEIERWIAA